MEDAVKARTRGKGIIQLDAMGLLDFYERLRKDDPRLPDPAKVRSRSSRQYKAVAAQLSVIY